MCVLVTVGNKSYLGNDVLDALRHALKSNEVDLDSLRHADVWAQVPMTYTALRRMIDVAADQLK